MPTLIYTEKENGDLKLVAEIDEDVEDGEAVELLLEESPRLRADRFVVLAGTLDNGVMSVVEQAEEVITTTTWKSSRGNGASAATPKKRGPGRPRKTPVDDGMVEAPAPKRRGRPPGSKNKPKTATATGAPKRRGRPPGSKNKPKAATSTRRTVKSGGFKRSAASDE